MTNLIQSAPLIAFLNTGSGAEAPFWGKIIVMLRALTPLLPIRPLCCLSFQLFLGIPRENNEFLKQIKFNLTQIDRKVQVLDVDTHSSNIRTNQNFFVARNKEHYLSTFSKLKRQCFLKSTRSCATPQLKPG